MRDDDIGSAVGVEVGDRSPVSLADLGVRRSWNLVENGFVVQIIAQVVEDPIGDSFLVDILPGA